MNSWPFVAAAYGATLAGTLALLFTSLLAMRRAERDADAIRRER